MEKTPKHLELLRDLKDVDLEKPKNKFINDRLPICGSCEGCVLHQIINSNDGPYAQFRCKPCNCLKAVTSVTRMQNEHWKCPLGKFEATK